MLTTNKLREGTTKGTKDTRKNTLGDVAHCFVFRRGRIAGAPPARAGGMQPVLQADDDTGQNMKPSKSITSRNLSGAAVAIAAAGLFLTGAANDGSTAQVAAKVQCQGVNACKGKSDCATATSACHGQNACKGQGWVSMTEKECQEKGGKIERG